MFSQRFVYGSGILIVLLILVTLILSILLISNGGLSRTNVDQVTNPGTTETPAITNATTVPVPNVGPWTTLRLPNTVIPTVYHIHMNPHIEEGWFEGFEYIQMKLTKPTNVLYLHIDGLHINSTQITPLNFPTMPYHILQQFYYEPNSFWVMILKETLPIGEYSLSLQFTGSLTKYIVGFYRSVYKNRITGKNSFLVTTKFEPTFARRAFPCFDEPNKKAQFQMNLYHDPISYPTALSNTQVTTSQMVMAGPFKNTWVTSFALTKPMSTYLVCFIVSDFVNLTTTSNHGVLVRSFAPSDRINETAFALKVAAKTLDYYDDYFSIPYNISFPKLDLVSIPDFISGAMENWGIITFRETRMLYMDDASYSINDKVSVAEVVCHELAHMWFGNLVTMDWWDDLWLNEGFATFVSYVKGLKNIFPQWQPDTIFILDELQPALVLDSAPSSHPIIQNISKPSDINSAFDSITYSKGSSVLRMLEDTLTPPIFKQGITAYLKKYAYKNAKTSDLWTELTAASGIDLKNLMDTWTLQMAYPVLNYDSSRQRLSQTRFCNNPSVNVTPVLWTIPIKFVDDQTMQSRLIIMNSTKRLQLPQSLNEHQWVKFNPNSKGFFRVNYDIISWKKLASALKNNFTVLSGNDRTELLDDSFNLAAAGQLDYGTPLSMIGYISNEVSYVPLTAAFSNINYASTMLRATNTTAFHKLQMYVGGLSIPLLQKTGWNSPSVPDVNQENLQSLIIGASCAYGNSACITKASQIFQKWINNQATQIPANYRRSVFKYGISNVANAQLERVWNLVLARYKNATTADQTDLRYCLAQTRNATILRRYLELGNDPSIIRDQDYWSFLRYIALNPYAGDMAFDWYNSNYNDLMNRFGIDDRYFGRGISYTTSNFNTQAQLQKVQDFIQKNQPAGAGKQPRIEAVATITRNIQWVVQNSGPIYNWLSVNS